MMVRCSAVVALKELMDRYFHRYWAAARTYMDRAVAVSNLDL